jgi:hypothetical protein
MREKLIELIDEAAELYPSELEAIADHLIANGVTVTDNNVGKWISVKERLPIEEAKAHEQEWCEEYCEFIVMIERGLLPTTLYYDWENNEWFRINTALERETYKVTHWQALPEPPKGE